MVTELMIFKDERRRTTPGSSTKNVFFPNPIKNGSIQLALEVLIHRFPLEISVLGIPKCQKFRPAADFPAHVGSRFGPFYH